MLLKKEHTVNLKKSYYKILYLYPAKNDTFVFLGMLGLKQDCVTHVDKQGNVLFEHVFPKPMNAAGMMVDNEFILLETRQKWYMGTDGGQSFGPCITILDLDTHKFKRTPFHFFNEQTDQTCIRCFAETKLLCIQQNGRYNDNRFKLSYFQYPLQSDSKPANVYESKDNEWTYEYIVRQANCHSMMAWFKVRHDQEWEFKTYDLRDDPAGKLKTFNIKQKIGLMYGMDNFQVVLSNMWETTKNSFMMVCISNRTDQQKNKNLGVIQNNYICDTLAGTVREAKFQFGEMHDLQIDQQPMGAHCMFRTFTFKDGKALETPVYYVNNSTETIVAEQTCMYSYLQKDEPTGVEPGMMIHNEYENGDCTWFKCSSKKIINPE